MSVVRPRPTFTNTLAANAQITATQKPHWIRRG